MDACLDPVPRYRVYSEEVEGGFPWGCESEKLPSGQA